MRILVMDATQSIKDHSKYIHSFTELIVITCSKAHTHTLSLQIFHRRCELHRQQQQLSHCQQPYHVPYSYCNNAAVHHQSQPNGNLHARSRSVPEGLSCNGGGAYWNAAAPYRPQVHVVEQITTSVWPKFNVIRNGYVVFVVVSRWVFKCRRYLSLLAFLKSQLTRVNIVKDWAINLEHFMSALGRRYTVTVLTGLCPRLHRTESSNNIMKTSSVSSGIE